MSSCLQGGNSWHSKGMENAMMKKKGSHDDGDRDGEYNHNHTTKTAGAANDEGNDEYGTRTEDAGDRYDVI